MITYQLARGRFASRDIGGTYYVAGERVNIAAAWTDMEPSGFGFFRGAATDVRIKAGGNVNDTAAGTGAQEVTIFGVDAATGLLTAEPLATAGAAASAVSQTTFSAFNGFYVSGVGTGGVNAGIVTLENSAGTVDITQIEAGAGWSRAATFATPANAVGIVRRMGWSANAAVVGGRYRMLDRDSGATYTSSPPMRSAQTYVETAPDLIVPPNSQIDLQGFGTGSVNMSAWLTIELVFRGLR